MLQLADVEREYLAWLSSKAAASGRDTLHAIQEDGDHAPLCFLGGCDVSAATLANCGVTHVLSLVSPRRGQRAAAVDGEFVRLVLELEDEFDAELPLTEALAFLSSAARTGSIPYVHCELGRSRSAAVVIAWLMHRRAEACATVSLLDCWALVSRTRRISALNYGFFARLCDLEAQLRGGGGGDMTPSMTLLDYVRLPLCDASQFAYQPPPTADELCAEGRLDEGCDTNGPEVSRRQIALRRLVRNFRFVAEELEGGSPACAAALRALDEK